jgi:glycerate kinase
VIVGVGGTATTDGGVGLREALGGLPDGVELIAALDVDNPLLGPQGAAAVYGPQKGASPEQVEELERRLAGLELASAGRPGAGAGGGIGGMLMELGA